MSEKSFFWNDQNGDKLYDSADWALFFALFIGNGVFAKNFSQALSVVPAQGLSIAMSAGNAFIDGRGYTNGPEPLVRNLSTASPNLSRIDRLVLRWSINDRFIRAFIKEGSYASNPQAPAIQRDDNIKEYVIADILVRAGAISITQSDITDQRLNGALCGIVTGLVEGIDFTSALAQFNEQFYTWFNEVKDALDGDTAGNLLGFIKDLQDTTKALQEAVKRNIITLSSTAAQALVANTLTDISILGNPNIVGTGLTYDRYNATSPYGIKVGAGISKIKLSGLFTIVGVNAGAGVTGFASFSLVKNRGGVYTTIASAYNVYPATTTAWHSAGGISPFLVDVQAGDIIFMRGNSSHATNTAGAVLTAEAV